MDQDVAPKANAPGGPASQPDRSGQPNDADRHVEPRSDTDTDIEQRDGDIAKRTPTTPPIMPATSGSPASCTSCWGW